MDLEPLLARQLKKAGHPDPTSAPSTETWQQILKRISAHYHHMREDRDMLVRSLELLTAEMAENNQHDHGGSRSLAKLMAGVAEALSVLSSASQADIADDSDVDDATRELEGAEEAFLSRLSEVNSSSTGSSPEADALREHFSRLSGMLKKSLEERASHQSLVRSVEEAGSVQRLLMPERPELERPFLRLAAYSTPATECSGDWWTVHDLPDGRILIAIGDVTGHGLAAGIITGAAKASCEVALTIFGDRLNSSSFMQVMNCGIEGTGRQEILMTSVVAIVDPHERSLTITNAGHVLPYLVRRSDDDRPRVNRLRTHGPPLGVARKATYNAVKFELEDDDVLLLYTDGVIERENPRGEQFGRKNLSSVLEQSYAFEPMGIRDALLHHLTRHAENAPLDDDITFVVARFGDSK